MKQNAITVMIPTYNREKCLLKVLECLKNQTCQDFEIVISDNCSDYDVKSSIEKYEIFFGDRLHLIVRNTNVGSTVNINGVFTLANTKWGWLLGDDDFPLPNAVETIYSYLRDDIGALHFSLYDLSDYFTDYIDLNDLPSFVDLFWQMSNGPKEIVNLQGDLIFMSNKVYNLDIIRQYLFQQNTYGYTRVPQIISILIMLDCKKGTFRIVDRNLVSVSDTSNQSWKMTNIALGTSTFSHVPFHLSGEERKKLNLIVMFKYTHVLRYRLQGEISRYNIGLIYDGIFKRNLRIKDRIVFNLMMRINPSGIIAKQIVNYKNKRIKLPKSREKENIQRQ